MCVLALSATIASSAMQPPTIAVDAVYQAIRANDIGRLRSLVHTAGDANQKDAAGVPLLMTSAAVGSVEAMTLLLDKGPTSTRGTASARPPSSGRRPTSRRCSC
jgi:hypothetical protein